MRLTHITIALALIPALAQAQIGNPAFMAPDTRFDRPGVPAPDQPNNTDKLFSQLLTEGGLAEVNLGELATDKAQSTAVQEFARMMINDHSEANDNLARIARGIDVELPEELNAEHMNTRARIAALDGTAFDIEYMHSQVADHQKATQLLIWEIGSGQDAELQQFAASTLPGVMEHLRMARSILEGLIQGQAAVTAR